MDIYLDMNILISYIKQENLNLVKSLNYAINNTNIKFPYSPAHIEEIAVINRRSNNPESDINKNLRIISKICKNYEYLPTPTNGILTLEEEPYTCYQRVMQNYDNTTIVAEDNEKEKVKNWKSLKLSLNIEELNLINPLELFQKDEINILLKKYLNEKLPLILENTRIHAQILNTTFEINPLYEYMDTKQIPNSDVLQNNHKVTEILFELIFDFLDYIGYKNDKRAIKKNKYRSRMHDISHSIYATKANYFMTNDDNFSSKTIAIYQLFNFKTKVIGFDDLNILSD